MYVELPQDIFILISSYTTWTEMNWSETDISGSDYTESSKKMDGIWNRYNLKSTRWIYTFGVLKCSEKFKVLDLP